MGCDWCVNMFSFGDKGHRTAALIVGYLSIQVANDALFACPLCIHRLLNSFLHKIILFDLQYQYADWYRTGD